MGPQVAALALDGWAPDAPDFRDWMFDGERAGALRSLARSFGDGASAADCREGLGEAASSDGSSSAAAACCKLVEYFRRTCEGDATQLSFEFLHQVCDVFLGGRGAGPISLRTALKAMVLTGVPPERFVRALANNKKEALQTPACYMYAPAFRDLPYYRLDCPNPRQTLSNIKQLLRAGIPCVAGLSLPSSFSVDPRIGIRAPYDSIIGGAAVVIVGFDDHYRLPSAGAVCFQGTWGDAWGEKGFGWISYELFLARLVADVWTAIKPQWLATLRQDRDDYRSGP